MGRGVVLGVPGERAAVVLVLLGEGLPRAEDDSPQHDVVRPTVGLNRDGPMGERREVRRGTVNR